jgi:hypothetical protein
VGSAGSSSSSDRIRYGSAAVIIIVAAACPGHLLASSPLSAAGETMAMKDNDDDNNNDDAIIIKFASLSAYDSRHDYLGKIKDNTTFKSGDPVFLQANFTTLGDPTGTSNNNDHYTVVIEVRNSEAPETVALSSVQTKLDAAGGAAPAADNNNNSSNNNLAVETSGSRAKKPITRYWFLAKVRGPHKTSVPPPVASVRVQVA